MTKAEEAALKAYPVKQRYNDYYGDYEDMNIVERVSFQEGYEQAEKDLALTWEDIMVICEHYVDVNYEYDYHSIQEKYEEILRRFKEAKK